MRICCLGMVKNEADVIEAFVRHALRFADQICLLENGSTDGTREILAELQREGLPLTVIEDPIIGYFQSEKMTWLYRRAVPLLKPDFVLLLDADEFLVAPDRAALEAALGSIRAGRYGAVRWRNYVLRPEEMDAAGGDPPRRIRHHLLPEHDNGQVKAVVRCDHAPPEQMVIHQGNHAIGTVDPALAPRRAHLAGLALAHYPVRSLEQIRQKVLGGWLAYAERNRLAGERPFGRHWQLGFEAMLADDDTARAAALAMNLRYGRVSPRAPLGEVLVDAPLDAAYELRFPMRRPSVLRTLMHAFANHLAAADRQRPAPSPPAQARAEGVPGSAAEAEAASPERPAQDRAAGDGGTQDAAMADARPGDAAAGAAAPGDAPAEAAAPVAADLPPLRHLLARYAPRSVLDLDCGEGTLLLDARDRGVARCVGVDAGDAAPGAAMLLPPGSLRRSDTTRPLDLRETFDLVVAIRPRAGLSAHRVEIVVDNIVRHASRAILFTLPWPVTRWLVGFAARGWHPNLQETLAVRLVASRPVLRHALVVLERMDTPDDAAAVWVRRAASLPLPGEEPRGTVTTPLHDLDCVAASAASPAEPAPGAAAGLAETAAAESAAGDNAAEAAAAAGTAPRIEPGATAAGEAAADSAAGDNAAEAAAAGTAPRIEAGAAAAGEAAAAGGEPAPAAEAGALPPGPAPG